MSVDPGIPAFILTSIADARHLAEATGDDAPAVCIAAELLLTALRNATTENDDLRRRLAGAESLRDAATARLSHARERAMTLQLAHPEWEADETWRRLCIGLGALQ